MICDKCGGAVELSNDAVALEFLAQYANLPGAVERLMYGARHLKPTGGCEGSPSRWQYMDGAPRDTRGYSYHEEYEERYRKAYRELQEG
jgi:hypothetical protein